MIEHGELPVVEAGEVVLSDEEALFEEEETISEEDLEEPPFEIDETPIVPPHEEEDIDPLGFTEE